MLNTIEIYLEPLHPLERSPMAYQKGWQCKIRDWLWPMLKHWQEPLQFYVLEPLVPCQFVEHQMGLTGRVKLLHAGSSQAIELIHQGLTRAIETDHSFNLLNGSRYDLPTRIYGYRPIEPVTYDELWRGAYPQHTFTLNFVSPTTFGADKMANGEVRQIHSYPLPDPRRIFHSLWKAWATFAPPKWSISENLLDTIDSCLQITSIQDLQVARVLLGYKQQAPIVKTGFTGSVTMTIKGSVPAHERQQMMVLAHYAQWVGVGQQPTLGLGQTEVKGF